MGRRAAAGVSPPARGKDAKRRGRPLKAMLDTNIFDLIAADESGRLRSGLENDTGIALYVCDAQLAELGAVNDAARGEALVALARGLCRSVAPVQPPRTYSSHARDAIILATAAQSCDLVVTQDRGFRERARLDGIQALSFEEFAALLRLG
jgi:rRNA-processing protein FCF1